MLYTFVLKYYVIIVHRITIINLWGPPFYLSNNEHNLKIHFDGEAYPILQSEETDS